MADMQVIVGTRIEAPCASITCMIRHYVSPKGEVIFDHLHNAAMSVLGFCPERRKSELSGTLSLASRAEGRQT